MTDIIDAIVSVLMVMGLFGLAYGVVWVVQRIHDKNARKDNIAI